VILTAFNLFQIAIMKHRPVAVYEYEACFMGFQPFCKALACKWMPCLFAWHDFMAKKKHDFMAWNMQLLLVSMLCDSLATRRQWRITYWYFSLLAGYENQNYCL